MLASSDFFHPWVISSLKEGWDLEIAGASLIDGNLDLLEDHDDRKVWTHRARRGAVWVITVIEARRQDPKVDFYFWAGYGSDKLSDPTFPREDISVRQNAGEWNHCHIKLDKPGGEPALHGQPMAARFASFDFEAVIWDTPYWEPQEVTDYAPKNPNQGGVYDYMGADYGIGDHDDDYWIRQLLPTAKYPGVFMTEDVALIKDTDYPKITGTSHLKREARFPEDHWINYSDPSSPWRDRAAGGVACADNSHDSIGDAVCQWYLERGNPFALVLTMANAERWLRHYPGEPKGNWDHRSGSSRSNGRRLKAGIWMLRVFRKAGLGQLAGRIATRLAQVYLQQQSEFHDDLRNGKLPFRTYDGGTGFSPPFCGLWWLGLEEVRRFAAEIYVHIPGLTFMQAALSKFVFNSFGEVDGKMRIAYKVELDGVTVATKDGRPHYSSMGFYGWLAAMAYQPTTPEEIEKYAKIEALKDSYEKQWTELADVEPISREVQS